MGWFNSNRKKSEMEAPEHLLPYIQEVSGWNDMRYSLNPGNKTIFLKEPMTEEEIADLLKKANEIYKNRQNDSKQEADLVILDAESGGEETVSAEKILEMVPEIPEPLPEPAHPKKQLKKKRIRSVQVMTRLTPEEAEKFHKRVEATGQTQADYIRSAILTGQIKELPTGREDIQELIKELSSIKGNLGKIGGLMKSIIKPNQDNEAITPEEWQMLKKELNNLHRLQKNLEKELNKIWQ